jgi:hypothetical protein
VVLVPGHIVVTYEENVPPHQQLLSITSFTSLDTYWKPIRRIAYFLADTPFQAHVHERLEFDKRPLLKISDPKLLAFPSPLHRDTFRIVIYVTGSGILETSKGSLAEEARKSMGLRFPTDSSEGAALISYRLSLTKCPETLYTCVQTSAVPAPDQLRAPQSSYAGYCLRPTVLPVLGTAIVDARHRRAGKVFAHKRTVLTRNLGQKFMYLSCSGAVVVVEGSSVTVSYYT